MNPRDPARPPPSPEALAAAAALLDVTHARRVIPAALQGAWNTLKEARGQSVRWGRLVPHYGVTPDPPPAEPFTATIDAARPRILEAVRAYLGRHPDDAA